MGQIRKTDSKKKIQAALVGLLAEKDVHLISVSAITKRAGVNRGTFYLNYLDKEDLIAQTQQDFFNGLEAVLKAHHEDDLAARPAIFAEETIQGIAEYLRDHYRLVRVLLTSSLQTTVTDRFFELLWASFANRQGDSRALAIPEPYATKVVFSSIINIFSLWITRGMVESIPELVVIIRRYRALAPNEIMLGR